MALRACTAVDDFVMAFLRLVTLTTYRGIGRYQIASGIGSECEKVQDGNNLTMLRLEQAL